MPQLNVLSSSGSTALLAANALRTSLFIQNNSPVDIRFRLFGPVSIGTAAQAGLVLRANGGFLNLSGSDAGLGFWATHDQAGITATLDYDSNVP